MKSATADKFTVKPKGSVECWDHYDNENNKPDKSKVPSISYAYFPNFFKIFIVKSRSLRTSHWY